MAIKQQPKRQTTSIGWKRVVHEVYCWLALLLIFPSFYYGGIPLFILQTVLGAGVACLMDWFISPTMSNNVQRITERGYASCKLEVLISIYLTILTSESIILSLAVYFGCLEDEPRLDVALVLRVLATLAFNEVVFTTNHRCLLHGTAIGGRIHAMHHCCQPSSFSTSFMFHFLDSNTEFTLTTIVMAVTNNFMFHDPFSLLISLQVIYVWYTVGGHSENVKLPHYYHHLFVNANYTAYIHQTKYIGRRLALSQDHVKEELAKSRKRKGGCTTLADSFFLRSSRE